MHYYFRKGFTLIEILIVLGVLAVIAVFVAPSFLGGSHTTDLDSVTQQIASSLQEAQSDSAGQVQGAAWGVHFSNATNTAPFYAVFAGTSYATGTVKSTYRLPPSVGFVTSTLPTGSSMDVLFSQVSGAAALSTTIKLYVLSQPSISSTINIGNFGQIAYVTPSTPTSQPSGGASGGICSSPEALWVVSDNGMIGGGYIGEFSTTGTLLQTIGTGFGTGNTQFTNPGGVELDSNGNVWIAQFQGSAGVKEFSATGTYLSTIAASSSYDSTPWFAIDSTGNFWISDVGDQVVREFSATGTYLNQVGSSGYGNGQFYRNQQPSFDASGNMWIADSVNSRIEEFSPTSTYLRQFPCSSGACVASSSNGYFYGYYDYDNIAFNTSGDMWILDPSDNRVEEFSPTGTYMSQIGCPTGACVASSSNGMFYGPDDIAIDSNGDIWVVDDGNERVEEFSPTGTYMSQFGSGVLDGPLGIAIVEPSGCH